MALQLERVEEEAGQAAQRAFDQLALAADGYAHRAHLWLNVKDFGAVGDGVADDTAAFTDAIAALTQTGDNRGGTIFVPRGIYLVTSGLNLDSTNSVVLKGEGGNSDLEATRIKYTATGTTPLISCHAAQGLRIQGIKFVVAAAFTGDLIQCGSIATINTTNLEIDNCWIGGDGSTNDQSASLLSLNGVIGAHIHDSSFMFAVYGIKGRVSDWSNTVTVDNCMFNFLTSGAIHQPGEAWKIDNCSFEALQSGAAGAITSARDSSHPARGVTISNSWFGDTTVNSGTWIDIHGFGINISGNHFSGQSSQTAIALWGVEGCSIRGNELLVFGVGVDLDGTLVSGLEIVGNRFQTVTTPLKDPVLLISSSIHGNATGEGRYVASTATLTPPFAYDLIHVTGTTNITDFSAANAWWGRKITLTFAGVLTFTDGNFLKLNGNFVTSADDSITLVYDSTTLYWHEMSRSVN